MKTTIERLATKSAAGKREMYYQVTLGKNHIEVWRETACALSVCFESTGRELFTNKRVLAPLSNSGRRASFFRFLANRKTPLHPETTTRFHDDGRKP